MGQHDPLDGYITSIQLQTTASKLPEGVGAPELREQVAEFKGMIELRDLATADALGIGGLMVDAFLVAQLMEDGAVLNRELLEALLEASFVGIEHYARQFDSGVPPNHRPAFRELGLAIGLHAVTHLSQKVKRSALRARLEALKAFLPIGAEIESFWRNPDHQNAVTWTEYRDINEVMLATSLVPEGLLVLPTPR